jgi:CRISPR-associated protein Cmr2
MSKQMIHDYFAAYSYLDTYDHIQRRVIDYLVGEKSPPEEFAWLSAIQDPAAKVEMLALAQLSIKNYAASGDPRERSRGLKGALPGVSRSFEQRVDKELAPLGLTPALPALDELPELSFALHFRFRLRQPYLSHDEAALYLLDNPVRKEKVFRLPYVAPTQWKGTLHSVMVQELMAQWAGKQDVSDKALKELIDQRTRLLLLFGSEKDLFSEDPKKKERLFLDELLPNQFKKNYAKRYRAQIKELLNKNDNKQNNEFFAGRLQFYPSFFTQLGLEVMNPHSRKTGSGEVPILFETVPRGAEAGFTLLYVPHDKVGQQPSPQVRQQVAEDLQLIARGLHEMFCLYGFGAKVTSGFGRAEEKIEGKLALRARHLGLSDAGKPESQPAGAAPLPKYLEAPDRLKPEYLHPDGTFRERSEADLKKMGKMSRWEYDKARRWWLAQVEKAKQLTPESQPAKPAWPEVEFRSFAELEQKAEQAAEALQKGDAS